MEKKKGYFRCRPILTANVHILQTSTDNCLFPVIDNLQYSQYLWVNRKRQLWPLTNCVELFSLRLKIQSALMHTIIFSIDFMTASARMGDGGGEKGIFIFKKCWRTVHFHRRWNLNSCIQLYFNWWKIEVCWYIESYHARWLNR